MNRAVGVQNPGGRSHLRVNAIDSDSKEVKVRELARRRALQRLETYRGRWRASERHNGGRQRAVWFFFFFGESDASVDSVRRTVSRLDLEEEVSCRYRQRPVYRKLDPSGGYPVGKDFSRAGQRGHGVDCRRHATDREFSRFFVGQVAGRTGREHTRHSGGAVALPDLPADVKEGRGRGRMTNSLSKEAPALIDGWIFHFTHAVRERPARSQEVRSRLSRACWEFYCQPSWHCMRMGMPAECPTKGMWPSARAPGCRCPAPVDHCLLL